MHKRVLFLDRDGIIVEEMQVDSLEKIRYIPGVFGALSRLRKDGSWYFAMVSNQDGVGTPSFPKEAFEIPHQRIMETLNGEGITFDAEHIDYSLPEDNCPGRKPKTGMLTEYMDGSYDLDHSVVIGDRLTDVQLAKNIGCKAIWFTDESRATELVDELKEVCILVSDNWATIASFLLDEHNLSPRTARLERKTKETEISLKLNLDGGSLGSIHTHIPFFDHMLEQVLRHSGCDLDLHAHGDLVVDEHHTVEDVGIALGGAFREALGDKRGINRYGAEILPMDEVLAQVALDFSGRPYLQWDVSFKREYIGTFPTEMVEHFFKSFSDSAGCNLSLKVSDGNAHHQCEALFKAFARAIKEAVHRNPYSMELPTTKGML
ncbi:bifunctional histidinol-phosphatase/imidazoleglycerol-phosphate dehydratase HisB [Sphaerochaeta sp. S2]|uniref:bifunctional histidinol-phosphatase/imidazoleglycerol-phosphate dehydratase HisB n=1 Tax=Sphaerochaeta sp. S2 TaxID=2798868 RepID=UPI0018E91F96|nr:bifunctional histidinol-phosphatase/imidazoleglycerol-phosphate dehydratase HisB [Sphaerochaeta sp. S2]MBJ2355882.1 bifunctional histidinol-phosphatase/imidazoleglycerol-phosphate dehydratase HisB [Sphaerochaeta sp. S2]